MKYSYRGISYESEPSLLEIKEGDVGGRYRGNEWNHHYPRHMLTLQPKLYRQYRGVSYSTCPMVATEHFPYNTVPSSDSARSVPKQKETPSLNHPIAKLHLENLRRNLERRLQVAKENGNETLVLLLEKEFKQLILN